MYQYHNNNQQNYQPADHSDGERKFRQMTETPVPRLVSRLAVPTIITMMSTALYNMADTYFVSQLGTSATGGVGISFSLMAVIQALGFLLGIGAGNYTSRLLGRKEHEQAARVVNTGFFSALLLGLLFAVGCQTILPTLVLRLGATPTIAPYAVSYLRVILLGTPYWTATLALNICLRCQGAAFYGMVGMVTGNLLNLVLDPLLIFVFDLGIAGAAWATILCQLTSFAILLYNCGRGSNIRISWRQFSPSRHIYARILSGGLPSFCRQGLSSLATICLNVAAGPYGDAAIAAMSIVTRLSQFATSAVLGFGQGFQPVCGFNYGAKRYDRVLAAYRFCIKLSVGVLLVGAVLALLLAPQIIYAFRREDAEVIAIGARALRYQAVTLPLFSLIVVNNMTLQTIGKSLKASILALARQGLFFLPLIWFLPRSFGLTGILISQPLADLATFGLSLPLGHSVIREMRQQSQAAGH